MVFEDLVNQNLASAQNHANTLRTSNESLLAAFNAGKAAARQSFAATIRDARNYLAAHVPADLVLVLEQGQTGAAAGGYGWYLRTSDRTHAFIGDDGIFRFGESDRGSSRVPDGEMITPIAANFANHYRQYPEISYFRNPAGLHSPSGQVVNRFGWGREFTEPESLVEITTDAYGSNGARALWPTTASLYSKGINFDAAGQVWVTWTDTSTEREPVCAVSFETWLSSRVADRASGRWA